LHFKHFISVQQYMWGPVQVSITRTFKDFVSVHQHMSSRRPIGHYQTFTSTKVAKATWALRNLQTLFQYSPVGKGPCQSGYYRRLQHFLSVHEYKSSAVWVGMTEHSKIFPAFMCTSLWSIYHLRRTKCFFPSAFCHKGWVERWKFFMSHKQELLWTKVRNLFWCGVRGWSNIQTSNITHRNFKHFFTVHQYRSGHDQMGITQHTNIFSAFTSTRLLK
jgi:hypothetical protein